MRNVPPMELFTVNSGTLRLGGGRAGLARGDGMPSKPCSVMKYSRLLAYETRPAQPPAFRNRLSHTVVTWHAKPFTAAHTRPGGRV